MTEFTIKIELGNDAMHHGNHVARALRIVAKKIEDLGFTCANGGGIMDANGNTVGKWEVK